MRSGRTRTGSGRCWASWSALTALAIAFNVDRHFQTAIPGYTEALQKKVEQNERAQSELRKLRGNTREQASNSSLKDFGAAPELTGLSHWINSDPVTLKKLRGKVVLVDFWTYSCINCLRTLPHVKAWYHTYRDRGLVVLGIHTPEFAFEHVPDNVEGAVRRLGIEYPVALDNDYGTWNAFQNQYWPAKYLIDRRGHLRYYHFGEGEYDTTESSDPRLSSARAPTMLPVANRLSDPTPKTVLTPETYLGYGPRRLERLRPLRSRPISSPCTASRPVRCNRVSSPTRATGSSPERTSPPASARAPPELHAREVHLVLGGNGKVGVFLDGQRKRTVRVHGSRLYTLLRNAVAADRAARAPLQPRRPGLRVHVRLGAGYCSLAKGGSSPFRSSSCSRRKRVSSAARASPDGRSASSASVSARCSSSSM